MVYGRFDSKIRFENESAGRFDSRFDSNEKNDSQVPIVYTEMSPQNTPVTDGWTQKILAAIFIGNSIHRKWAIDKIIIMTSAIIYNDSSLAFPVSQKYRSITVADERFWEAHSEGSWIPQRKFRKRYAAVTRVA